MKTAVFLGAGASKAFGFPLASELLTLIVRSLEHGGPGRGTAFAMTPDELALFRERLESFIPGLAHWSQQSKAQKEALRLEITITDLLSLVDHAVATGSVRAEMTNEKLQDFRRSLERAICGVLKDAETGRAPKAHDPLREQFIEWLLERRDAGALSIVTTNYDLVVEEPLFKAIARRGEVYQSIPSVVDFGFSFRDPGSNRLIPRPASATVQMLKLHGSLNSLRCPLCGETYLNVLGEIAGEAFDVEQNDFNSCICASALARANLVTPSLVRQVHDASLLGVWQAATEAMRTADEWFLIGYSLPPEDIAIRSLLVRAWEAREKPPGVTVIQYGNGVEQLHQLFFPRCKYVAEGLEHFLS